MSDIVTMDDLNEENMAKIAAMIGQTDSRPATQQGLPAATKGQLPCSLG